VGRRLRRPARGRCCRESASSRMPSTGRRDQAGRGTRPADRTPIVLVLACYHGDRGERRVTRTEFAILTMLFLLGGACYGVTST